MKRILYITAAVLCIAACAPKEQKVMARFVPERADDFIWENDLVCYRAYGEALEGNPTSPGFDIWVKTPGGLVADERYRMELEEGLSYHIDRGNGKDCYKVAVSLGGGASAPLVDGRIVYPATNYRSWEILSEKPEEVVFVLHYPAWDVNGVQVSLDKKITVSAGSYFCKAEDVYSGDFDELTIAAGAFTHEVEDTLVTENGFAIWEKASDTSVEPEEEGRIGVAVFLPGAGSVTAITANQPHLVCTKTVKSGEVMTYYFGSCWSKGDIKTPQAWFECFADFSRR